SSSPCSTSRGRWEQTAFRAEVVCRIGAKAGAGANGRGSALAPALVRVAEERGRGRGRGEAQPGDPPVLDPLDPQRAVLAGGDGVPHLRDPAELAEDEAADRVVVPLGEREPEALVHVGDARAAVDEDVALRREGELRDG